MSFQTIGSKQLTCLFIKWTWQNNRPIVLFTVFAQLFALALVPWTLDQMERGIADLKIHTIYYNNLPAIIMGCLSACLFGYILQKQQLRPFHFPKAVQRWGKLIIIVSYSVLLTIAILLLRYVVGVAVFWQAPQIVVLRSEDFLVGHGLVIFSWLIMACTLGVLYVINRRRALLVSVITTSIVMLESSFIMERLYIGTLSAVVVMMLTIAWTLRQEVSR